MINDTAEKERERRREMTRSGCSLLINARGQAHCFSHTHTVVDKIIPAVTINTARRSRGNPDSGRHLFGREQ